MKDVKTITDVCFYDAADHELLHMPDPEFIGDEGLSIRLPKDASVEGAVYMIVTYDDGRTERINLSEST